MLHQMPEFSLKKWKDSGKIGTVGEPAYDRLLSTSLCLGQCIFDAMGKSDLTNIQDIGPALVKSLVSYSEHGEVSCCIVTDKLN